MQFLKKNKKILIIILILIMVMPTITLGRLVYSLFKDHYLITKNFYFQSDLLKEKNAEYTINNWSGVDTYILNINMNSILNDKKYATSDIYYNISYNCSNKVNCYLDKNEGIIYASNDVLRNRDSFSLTITPKQPFRNNEEAEVEITTSSTSPYTKVLKAKFILHASKYGLSYEITDKKNDIFAVLRLTNSLTYYTVNEDFLNYHVNDEIEQRVYESLSLENKLKCSSLKVTLEFDPKVVNIDLTNKYYLKTLKNNPNKIYTTKLRKVLKDFGDYYENQLIDESTYNQLSSSNKNNVSKQYDYVYKLEIDLDAITSGDFIFYKTDKTKNYTYPFVNENSIIIIS